ncbi:NAD(P)-dependent oxidoreductase [Nesterenkonia aurantiaca]|uniref:NAD(P)-dependent oxidoreductase n=1 Tax=Nesterenkonia aurantiaca TaxID=1436010 RepID=UPI003EE7904C
MSAQSMGIIGTGAMGTPMAQRMLQAGADVFVYARRVKPELREAGVIYVDSPKVLAQQASTVLVMLPDLPELEPMIEGPDSLLEADTNLLIMVGSTSSAVRLRALAAKIDDATQGRVQIMDTPVSGGVEGARRGTLSIMAGGTEAQADSAREALSACGTVHHVGPLGAGEVAKACNQMIVSATMLALGEATVLGERSGIQPAKLLEVLGGGYAGSTLLEAKKDKLIAENYEPGGIAAYMLKDLGFATDIADDTGTAAMLLPSLVTAYRELVATGLGEEDLAVVRKFVAQRTP